MVFFYCIFLCDCGSCFFLSIGCFSFSYVKTFFVSEDFWGYKDNFLKLKRFWEGEEIFEK